MGYFSNGTEGELYQERWCSRCLHDIAGYLDAQDQPAHLAHSHHRAIGRWRRRGSTRRRAILQLGLAG